MILNLALIAALGATIWQVRAVWQQAQLERRKTLNLQIRPVTAPPVNPAPKPEVPTATKYVDVATKNLFSSDRNPTVVPEPPKPVEVKKMPPFPVVYGTIGLPSGTKAIMGDKPGGTSRSVRAGDVIGDFKVLALDTQNITFEWDGKKIDKKIEDLIDRSASKSDSGPVQSPAGPAVVAANNPPPPPEPPKNNPIGPGNDMTPTMKDCVRGDTTPYGTVQGGYKKTAVPTPFGPLCRWMKE